ncbi:MAG: preprotein translocase subunit YajC [Steroidobacteraceae bacterium]|nr:preprotein translocase subunit YajC [Steroidobacteraceae bacterium]MCW5573362.1 preprotein translocase subunit YajC [Steroidobacteraceae bacterium]
MNALIPQAHAQAAGASPGGSFAPLLMMVVFIVIFYFLLIRPQQKKAKEHQAMLGRIAVGDEVATAGGILGKVVEVGETITTLEVADGVRIKVQKFQITSLVPKGTIKSA